MPNLRQKYQRIREGDAMSDLYVNVESLDFWENATNSGNNLIGKLYLTQKVDVVSELPGGWVECRALMDGDHRIGFVMTKFLRSPVSPNREKLIASVSREFLRFEHGLGKENVEPFSEYVGEMWEALGEHIEGTDDEYPWAGAAISFMVRGAGEAYAGFRFSESSSRCVHHAIVARQQEDPSAPFWGLRLDEGRPEIGDIVARSNPGTAPAVDFDFASTHELFRSHADIVVQIDFPNNRLLAIGGNIGNSVGITRYDLAPGGFVADTGHTFLILKNRTDGDGYRSA